MKIGKAFHNADTPTKPLQGKGFVYKRGRLLGLEVAPPARPPGQARAADEGAPASAVATAPAHPKPTKGVDGSLSLRVRFVLPEEGVPTPEQRTCSKKRKPSRRASGVEVGKSAGEDAPWGTCERGLSFLGGNR